MKTLVLTIFVIIISVSNARAAGDQAADGGDVGKDFPRRTIEVIHPWGPGMAMSVSQIIADAMADELGVAITVISTPGSAGIKAFETVNNRPSDGYTIYDGYVAPLVLQPILGNAEWTFKDFIPLTAAASNAFSIASNPNEERWDDFEGMMAYGRENPGVLRYSSGSRNNLPHMVIAKVLQEYNAAAQNIPYETDGDAFKDLQSGVLDFAFLNVGNYLQDPEAYHIQLVLSELAASKASFHGAPSLADLNIDVGLSNLGPMGWTWWLVHKDTPAREVEILRGAMAAAMRRENVREAIARVGFVPLEWGPEDYEDIVGSVADQLQAMGNALEWERQALAELR